MFLTKTYNKLPITCNKIKRKITIISDTSLIIIIIVEMRFWGLVYIDTDKDIFGQLLDTNKDIFGQPMKLINKHCQDNRLNLELGSSLPRENLNDTIIQNIRESTK